MVENQAVRRAGAGVVRTAFIDEGLRAHMNKVYALMSIAMIITGMVAYVVGSDLSRAMSGQSTLIMPVELLQLMFASAFRWVIIFAPLAVVFLFSATIGRMSWSTAQVVFWVFAGLMGLSLSTIFAVYTGISIAQTFFVTAIAFASLSMWGYTTKKDISGWGKLPVHGCHRCGRGVDPEPVHRIVGASFCGDRDRPAGLRRADRLRHTADQEQLPADGWLGQHRVASEVRDHGCLGSVHQFHQHVRVASPTAWTARIVHAPVPCSGKRVRHGFETQRPGSKVPGLFLLPIFNRSRNGNFRGHDSELRMEPRLWPDWRQAIQSGHAAASEMLPTRAAITWPNVRESVALCALCSAGGVFRSMTTNGRTMTPAQFEIQNARVFGSECGLLSVRRRARPIT